MSEIKAVVFDLYGVLGLNGWQQFKAAHFAHRPEQWEPLRVLGQQVDAGLASDDVFVEAIAAATHESPETVRYQFEHTQPNLELLAFIKQELSGYKIGLLSNASHDVISGIFTSDEQQLFDAVVLSAFIGYTKPDPRTFRAICRELAVKPEQVIMVDDQVRHLAKAEALGMKTVQYTSARQTTEDIRKLLNI